MSDALAPTVSDELEQWIGSDPPKTLGTITELFGPRSFALVFVLLMALPALPLPTGGATHVFEVVTMLVALHLVVGRRCIWLPARWQRLQLAGPSRQKLLNALLGRIRWLKRFSRPRRSSRTPMTINRGRACSAGPRTSRRGPSGARRLPRLSARDARNPPFPASSKRAREDSNL